MKKIFTTVLLCIAAAAIATTIMISCDESDGNEGNNQLETEYFTIENSIYKAGDMPAATISEQLQVIGINNTVLNGGSSFVLVESDSPLSKFFVSVDGIRGYYTLDAEPANQSRVEGVDGAYRYQVTLHVSQHLGSDFTIRMSAETRDGEIMSQFTHKFSLLAVGTGALQVNLSFSNNKDLDLYLVLPDKTPIYWGNTGQLTATDPETGEWKVICGLDVDSNPNCDIDGINSENIFFPADKVMNGKYEVYVNMYSNCQPDVATSWTVTAIYKGLPVGNTLFGKTNPAAGVFPENAPSNPIGSNPEGGGALKVMEFTISGAAINPGDPQYGTRSFDSNKLKGDIH